MYSVISSVMSEGRTSRLYRVAGARQEDRRDRCQGFSGFPGDKYRNLYAFYAVPAQGHSAEEMGAAIHEAIDKLKSRRREPRRAEDGEDALQGRLCCAAWPTIRDWRSTWRRTN